jgi:hypothetical protein
MKRTSIRQSTRNFTIILAGLMLCVSILSAQTATRQRLVQADASPQEPQQKPKPTSNVDPLGMLNTPEPPKTPVNAPAVNKPAATPTTPKNTTYSSTLDTVLPGNGSGSSSPAANSSATHSSSLDAVFSGSPTTLSVAIRSKRSWILDPTVWGWLNGIMTDTNIFHLIDLNGGQLESGDLVNFRYQNTGQPVVIAQGQKERNLALGEGGSEAATFRMLKVVKDKIEPKGVIRNDDIFAIQASNGEYVKVTMVNPRQKLEASEKIGGGESYRLTVFEDDTTALAAGQASVEKAEARAQKDRARQERINDFMRGVERGVEQIKSDAEQERIRQAQEARQVAAQKVAAREAAARGAEAQQQLETFRNIEAQAKKHRDEQAAREAEQQVALGIAPKLLLPAPDGVLNNGCYNFAAVTRTYSWTAVPLATAYQLYVIAPGAIGPNLDVQVADTSYTEKSTAYSPEGSRFGITWKVRAMINGQWGAWSEERTFSYAPVNTNPVCRK